MVLALLPEQKQIHQNKQSHGYWVDFILICAAVQEAGRVSTQKPHKRTAKGCASARRDHLCGDTNQARSDEVVDSKI